MHDLKLVVPVLIAIDLSLDVEEVLVLDTTGVLMRARAVRVLTTCVSNAAQVEYRIHNDNSRYKEDEGKY